MEQSSYFSFSIAVNLHERSELTDYTMLQTEQVYLDSVSLQTWHFALDGFGMMCMAWARV